MTRFAQFIFLLLFYCFLGTSALAQVGIGTTTPDANAILELYSGTTPRGLLLPRMTTAQRTTLGGSLGTVHAGMLVADTSNTTGGLYVWDGNSWAGVATGGSFVQGTGTTGYLPRWLSPTDLGNSLLQDDGNAIGLGMAPPPDAKLGIMSNLPYGIQASATSTGLGNWGVYASVAGATGDNYGLYGFAYGNPGNKYGVQGFAMGDGGTKYGIYGTAIGTGTNWAGFFASGNVSIDNGLVLNGIPNGTGSHLLVRRFDNWVECPGI